MWTSPLNDSSITWMVVSTGCYQCSKSSSLSGSEWHVTVHPNPPQICSSAHDAAHTEVTRSLPRALCWCIFSTWWQYRAIYDDQPVELKITSLSCTAHYIKWLGNALLQVWYTIQTNSVVVHIWSGFSLNCEQESRLFLEQKPTMLL